jgi:hypothetical protein
VTSEVRCAQGATSISGTKCSGTPRLEGYLPPLSSHTDVLGFAVPLELCPTDGDLRLITTLTSFATAADVMLAELHFEAFLPADQSTADVLRRRWG